jgi:mycothiol system anti-sigma-R factor
MSCGKPHETPCVEVLEKVYLYLDSEVDAHDLGAIRQHLDECGPCLRQYGLEEKVNQLVARCCGQERAPDALKTKVLARIQQVRIEITETTVVSTD